MRAQKVVLCPHLGPPQLRVAREAGGPSSQADGDDGDCRGSAATRSDRGEDGESDNLETVQDIPKMFEDITQPESFFPVNLSI